MAALSPYIIIFITFCSTFIGGLLALKFGKHIHWLNALSAGILLGAAFFELFPEAIALNANARLVFSISIVAFILFHLLQRVMVFHACHDADKAAHPESHGHKHPDTRNIGVLGASGLAIHSFLDGSAIGLGFVVSPAIGLAVAIAIIAHDFGDGVSTVTLMLRHKNTRAKTFLLLAIDAVTPVIGALVALNLHVAASTIGLFLAFFAGFFLYLSTSDLLPEAHREDSSLWLVAATVAGVVIMFIVTLIAV